MVKAGLQHIHIQEPAEQHVVRQFLTESAFATNAVQTDQQARLQQAAGGIDGPTFAVGGVHLIEQRRQLQQGGIRETLDGPQNG